MHHFEGVCFSSWLFLISQLLEAGVRNSWNWPETGLGWDLNVINLNVHSFLRGRKFFILYRMVGRTWREVLTPGYVEPSSFPSERVAMSSSRGSSQTKESNSHVLHVLCCRWVTDHWATWEAPLRVCTGNTFLGHADAAGPESTLFKKVYLFGCPGS